MSFVILGSCDASERPQMKLTRAAAHRAQTSSFRNYRFAGWAAADDAFSRTTIIQRSYSTSTVCS